MLINEKTLRGSRTYKYTNRNHNEAIEILTPILYKQIINTLTNKTSL